LYLQKVDSAEYDLFSVVIHKGGAYGGHYHAFIRDVDSLGKWTHPVSHVIFTVNTVKPSHAVTS